eukprot:5076890-Lingulodinium_polyedra.AAC.1
MGMHTEAQAPPKPRLSRSLWSASRGNSAGKLRSSTLVSGSWPPIRERCSTQESHSSKPRPSAAAASRPPSPGQERTRASAPAQHSEGGRCKRSAP